MKVINKYLLLFVLALIIVSCGDDEVEQPTVRETIIAAGESGAASAQTAFIDTDNNYVIRFEEGVFEFDNTLSIDGKDSITIIGAGRDNTILDFSGQLAGGDGVLATNCNFLRFENLTIRDAKGDALKTRDCNTVSFVNIATIWSGEPSSENGAYGLYPVLCTEVYIDGCYAYGASDAGIYVGQSDKVILKNSLAEGNVAGIEIENTTNADVFNNEAKDNTGGILVFDLPGLTKSGANTRVFNNKSDNNNRVNFAPEGNIVSNVPIGTGVMVLSTKNVEIFNNELTDNNFANIIVSSLLIYNPNPGDPGYDPFPSGVNIHDNTYSMNGELNVDDQKALTQGLIQILSQSGIGQTDIFMDGLLISPDAVCINEDGASFVNINASDQTFMSITVDQSAHDCTADPLPEVSFDHY